MGTLHGENMKKSNGIYSRDYAIRNFREPWHAQLFAITINLYEREIFSWTEWVLMFSENLNEIQTNDCESEMYFKAWLTSLEKILLKKNKISAENLKSIMDGWIMAYDSIPHGQAIKLI